jgi:predicted  nucleic acid-binding Zn-ribbon protein
MRFAFLLLWVVCPTVASRSGSPVEKVVNLLKVLQDRIEQDGENEQKIYDKYACWCDISMKKKADAIDQARKDLRALSQEILKLKGKIATLASEIQELADNIAENEKLQADATALREKENAAYMAETTEMKQALAALQDAIRVLIEGSTLVQKGSAAALLQRARGAAAASTETSAMAVRKALDAMPMTAKISDSQLSALTAFVQDRSSSKYAPQSLTIQGILKDMYDTFSTDVEETTLKEATNNRDYELFIKTKQAEKAAMEAAKKLREEQKADAEQALAEATAMYDETDATKASDEEFFDATKESCLAKKAEMDLRVAARTEELAGISKALEILTSDSARELFASAIKVGKEVGADGESTRRRLSPSLSCSSTVMRPRLGRRPTRC